MPRNCARAAGKSRPRRRTNCRGWFRSSDVLGDFRVGSHWGDGANGLDQIAHAARNMGYHYVAVCDAAYSTATGRGLSPGELEQQIASIELMNAALPDDFRLLAGVEVDLSPDGDPLAPAELLRTCDVVVAAARTGLKAPRRELTRRLCRAMENPLVHVLALPPWRQSADPEMPPIDVDAILDTAAATRTCLEITGHPLRPGLPDLHVRHATERGVMLTSAPAPSASATCSPWPSASRPRAAAGPNRGTAQ